MLAKPTMATKPSRFRLCVGSCSSQFILRHRSHLVAELSRKPKPLITIKVVVGAQLDASGASHGEWFGAVRLDARFPITTKPWVNGQLQCRSRGNLHHPLLTTTMIRAQLLHMLACLSYTARLVVAQNDVEFPDLPTTPFIDTPAAGNFTWPSGSTDVFDQGTPMRITWESPYTQINLYLIWNQTVNEGIGSQRQLGSEDISPTCCVENVLMTVISWNRRQVSTMGC
jgi:hypothetical protein